MLMWRLSTDQRRKCEDRAGILETEFAIPFLFLCTLQMLRCDLDFPRRAKSRSLIYLRSSTTFHQHLWTEMCCWSNIEESETEATSSGVGSIKLDVLHSLHLTLTGQGHLLTMFNCDAANGDTFVDDISHGHQLPCNSFLIFEAK